MIAWSPGVLMVILASMVLAQPSPVGAEEPLRTVPSVDLERYTGTWYEIARIPNRFQRSCRGSTTATYTLRDDGRLTVVNRCETEEGDAIEAEGIARVADEGTGAKLEVSFVRIFGLSLFWGDYWILGLGEDYDYALIGAPGRKYGWILSRTPTLPEARLAELFSALRRQGYDPAAFRRTLQDKAEAP